MTVLDQAIASFSTHEQLVIRERLRRWSLANELGTRVVPNLHSERFLPPLPAMRDLLAVLLESPSDDWAVLETDYVAACRQFSCRGGTVTLATLPRWLGRAVDRSVWASYLYHHHRQGFGNCRREINRFIDKLLNQPGYSVLTSTAGQVPASRYPIWVTWEGENPNSDPFAFANSNSADHVRACLGLVSQRRGRSPQLLLFVYNHTSGQPLYRPTVADAANYTYFRPPLPEQGDAHGWTLPWSRHELPGNVQHEAIRPRPEALIAPCPLSNLRLPLRCFS